MKKFEKYSDRMNEDRYDDNDDGGYGEKYEDDKPTPKKPKKEKKKFDVGDILMCLNNKQGKLPYDAYDFLLTYKKFTVKSVSEKGNLDLGCKITKNDTGVEKIYLFSPNRFELESIVKAGKADMSNIGDNE